MPRRVTARVLPPGPQPEPAYPDYESVRAEADARSRGPIAPAAPARMEETARRRGADWCTAVLGRPFPGLHHISTSAAWMLLVADERGLTPALPPGVVKARQRSEIARTAPGERAGEGAREAGTEQMRRRLAALAAVGVEMTVRENTRHAGPRGFLRHAVPTAELVSGRARRHLPGRALCETPGRAGPLHLGEPVDAPATCVRCLSYLETVRARDAPAPPTPAERALLQRIGHGVVFTFRVRGCVTVRDTSRRSDAAWGHLGRKADAAVRKLERKGWAAEDVERSAKPTAGSGHRWRLTDAGAAALES